MNSTSTPRVATVPGTTKKKVEHLPERPVRILVADDEHLVAAELSLNLGALGFTVVGPAVDGEAAVHLGEVALPDLAVLDIRMPKLDGLQVAKSLFETHGIPSIIVSAYSDSEFVQSAQDASVFGYLVKPATPDQLRAAIGVAWARYRELVSTLAENADLKRRLEERRVIEQAKWVLVSKKGMTEPDAMKALQKGARDARKPLLEIAQGVINAAGVI